MIYETIELCIRSIRENTDYPDYRIIVFHSGNVENLSTYLDGLNENCAIDLYLDKTPREHGHSINRLLEICDTPLACILDSDIVIRSKDWLRTLVGYLGSNLGVSRYVPAGLRFDTTLYAPVYWPPCMLLDMEQYKMLRDIDWKIKQFPTNEYRHLGLFSVEDVANAKKDHVYGDTGWMFAEKVLLDNPHELKMINLPGDFWHTKIKHFGGVDSNWFRPEHPRVKKGWEIIRSELNDFHTQHQS